MALITLFLSLRFPVLSQGLHPSNEMVIKCWHSRWRCLHHIYLKCEHDAYSLLSQMLFLKMDHAKARFEMNEWSQQWDFHLSSVRQYDERGSRLGELQWFKVGSELALGFRSSLALMSVYVGTQSCELCVCACRLQLLRVHAVRSYECMCLN